MAIAVCVEVLQLLSRMDGVVVQFQYFKEASEVFIREKAFVLSILEADVVNL